MDNKLPTIKEIAKQLNVSVSTVSRALNDHPRISAATKDKIKKLATELNYEPNSQAIYFKKKKTSVVGVIIPSIREDFFSQAISGIETAAMSHNYTILFGQSNDDVEREKQVVEVMRKQRIDGLIISLSKQTSTYDHLQLLEQYNIPTVYFDRVPPFKKANKVYCDLYNGTVKLINWLASKGFKRIGFINGPVELLASKERLKGYIDGLAGKRIKVNMQLVETTDLSKDSTIMAMRNLLSYQPKINAVISFNDYVHMDAVQFAHKQGIRINEDILFVSYANLPITNYTAYPPIISVEQFPYDQGKASIDMIMRLINNNTSKNFYTQVIDASIVTSSSKKVK